MPVGENTNVTGSLAQGVRRFGRINTLGLATLIRREVLRFTNVWMQTLAAPVVTAGLFMVVFALAFGGRRGEVMGVEFGAFLAPGILTMTVIQNAFANTSSSIMISKIQGNIVDTLMPPLSAFELTTGYVTGGVLRGLCVGLAVGLVLFPITGIGVAHPLWALLFLALGAAMLSLAGILAAIVADKFDQMAAITNFIVTPLSFLSGTFYSIDAVPSAMRLVLHLNPVFYLIDGMRHGVLGVSDSSPWLGLAVLAFVNSGLALLVWYWFRIGYRLKS